MIEQEQWIKWTPIENLTEKFYRKKTIISDKSINFVFFSDEKNDRRIDITFKNSVLFYATNDETTAQKTLHNLKMLHGKELITQWTFFKIINSSLIKWLIEESYETLNKQNIHHYSLIELNSLIDIIATEDPIIKWI